VTRILFIEEDETAFEIRKCIAAVIEGIEPLEMYHAKDASEALELLEEICPDVVVIEHEEEAERDLFLDGLTKEHPPVLIDSEKEPKNKSDGVSFVRKDGSLAGIHELLRTAQALASVGTARTDLPQ
jgi:chemotaxis response regulator CheB